MYVTCTSFAMVILAMTPVIVEAIELSADLRKEDLSSPAPGDPISAAQLLRVWQCVKQNPHHFRNGDHVASTTLNDLLRQCRLYRPPEQEKKQVQSQSHWKLQLIDIDT